MGFGPLRFTCLARDLAAFRSTITFHFDKALSSAPRYFLRLFGTSEKI